MIAAGDDKLRALRQRLRIGELRSVLFSVRATHEALAERDLPRALRYYGNAQRDLYFAIGLFRHMTATAGLRAIVTDLGWKLEDAIKAATTPVVEVGR